MSKLWAAAGLWGSCVVSTWMGMMWPWDSGQWYTAFSAGDRMYSLSSQWSLLWMKQSWYFFPLALRRSVSPPGKPEMGRLRVIVPDKLWIRKEVFQIMGDAALSLIRNLLLQILLCNVFMYLMTLRLRSHSLDVDGEDTIVGQHGCHVSVGRQTEVSFEAVAGHWPISCLGLSVCLHHQVLLAHHQATTNLVMQIEQNYIPHFLDSLTIFLEFLISHNHAFYLCISCYSFLAEVLRYVLLASVNFKYSSLSAKLFFSYVVPSLFHPAMKTLTLKSCSPFCEICYASLLLHY